MKLLMIDDDDFKIERIQNELQKITEEPLKLDGTVTENYTKVMANVIEAISEADDKNYKFDPTIFGSPDLIATKNRNIYSSIIPSSVELLSKSELKPRSITGIGKSVPASFSILQHYFNSIYSESDTKFDDIERLLPGINFADIRYCDISNARVLWFGDDVQVPILDSMEMLWGGTNCYWAAKQIFKSEKQNRYLDYFTGLDLYTHQQYLYDKNSYDKKIRPINGRLYNCLSPIIIWIDYNCYFDEKHDTVKLRRREDEVFKNIRYRKDGDFVYISYDSVTGYHILKVINTKDHNSIFCITKEIKEKKPALVSLMETLGIYPYKINWGSIPHKSRLDLIKEDINRESKNNRKSRQGHRGKGDN